jgi:hypothetical protein
VTQSSHPLTTTESSQPWDGGDHMALCFQVHNHRSVALCLRLASVVRYYRRAQGDAAVGKSSLLIRLTDQRFLANPDPTVRVFPPHSATRLMCPEARGRVRVEIDRDTGRGQDCETAMSDFYPSGGGVADGRCPPRYQAGIPRGPNHSGRSHGRTIVVLRVRRRHPPVTAPGAPRPPPPPLCRMLARV